jgi:transcriptional regulator GlxA family with amidase domain
MSVAPTHGQSFRALSRKPPVWLRTNIFPTLRVGETKLVMLTTKLPLADIALICGFGDQNHFTRVFSQRGLQPGMWRRNNTDGYLTPFLRGLDLSRA